ncbi:phosphoinositide 3-kinase regulatory subunit 5 [Protopterus annectens]|uniref:phosphoinositide 3-kinase regulatory subunit 5 n=1 Tax=Protopterus annectens TaxID=7888 RepID=UPI001CFA651C|nr:phosphoinositide 3-kinase regulatory subunit 5 [Protopterus annectens]
MQHTTCTEDRIHHALERCLHGLDQTSPTSDTWKAGLCMNRWSLDELVDRDPGNFLILIEKILEKTKQVQENCEYGLLIPLALLFYSAVLRAPYFPPQCDLLKKSYNVFYGFLTWPIPYCSVCRELLAFINDELKAPGITYQRLVRAEQCLTTKSRQNKTITVLLLNPSEITEDFQSVAEKLCSIEYSQHTSHVILIKHLVQSNFGATYSLVDLHQALESKTIEELSEIYSECTEILENAVLTRDTATARAYVLTKLKQVLEKISPRKNESGPCGKIQTFQVPVAKCHTYIWDSDNFDILNEIISSECEISSLEVESNDEEEEDEFDNDDDDVEIDGCCPERTSVISVVSKDSVFSVASKDSAISGLSEVSKISTDSMLSLASKCSMASFVSSLSDNVDSGYVEEIDETQIDSFIKSEKTSKSRRRLTTKIYRFMKSKSPVIRRDSKYLSSYQVNCISDSPPSTSKTLPLRRTESLNYPDEKCRIPARSQRSQSLPQHALISAFLDRQLLQTVFFRRRPFLSCSDDSKMSALRVVVFGSDRISGMVARAYSNLRSRENSRPLLTKYFKLQFFYIPVKRSYISPAVNLISSSPQTDTGRRNSIAMDSSSVGPDESTNDVSNYLGMLDPWYDRNVASLMNLPTSSLCKQSSKTESDVPDSQKEALPILADIILYYCRNARHPVLLQLYQAELTFAGGEKTTEVFIRSLDLGNTAAIRAIKASGRGCKRFGIDDDREAVPLTLKIVYSKATVSGRSQWCDTEKSCTSVSLSKACKALEELDSKMEYLQLTMTEVVKRQSSKSKKSYNQQITVTQIKVDKVQIIGVNNSTFALCLDQDEKKILQSITKCEVSVCYKPERNDVWKLENQSSHFQQDREAQLCSLLCLPIATFSGAAL